MSTTGVLFAVVAAFGLAGQALFVRLATNRGRVTDALLVVSLVNVALVLPVTLLLVPSPTLSLRGVGAFVAAGTVGSLIGRTFFFAGIKRVGASRAEPIKASMPLFATGLAILLLGEQVSLPLAIGIVLIVLGIAVVSWEGSNADKLAGNDVPLIGLVFPLLAAFFFGVEPIFARIGLNTGTELLVGVTIKTVTASACFSAYLTWKGEFPRLSDLPTGDVRYYVLAGVASTVFMLSYYAGLEVAPVSVVTPIMQTSPLLVVVLSAIFLRQLETVTPRLVAAAVIIVAGGITVTLFG